MRRSKPLALFFVLLLLGCGSPFLGAATSPFLPPAKTSQAAPAGPSSLDKIEFNGFMQFNGEYEFSILDTATNKSYWLTPGQEIDGLRLGQIQFDANGAPLLDSIVVSKGAESKSLKLKNNEIVTQRLPVATPAEANNGNTARPNRTTASLSNDSDEEVRQRMRSVAEEIRRRRAERRKQMEQNAQATNR